MIPTFGDSWHSERAKKAATMSIFRVVTALNKRSKPGRLARPFEPEMPLSSNSATMRQPRAAQAAVSRQHLGWLATVCSPVLTRRYKPTRLPFMARRC